jgi:preprotein translocase subunit SecA
MSVSTQKIRPVQLTPSADARRTEVKIPEKVVLGLDGLVCDSQGKWKGRSAISRQIWEQAGILHAEAMELDELAPGQLKNRLREARMAVRRQGTNWRKELHNVLPIVVEAARRTTGLRAYRTQVAGALGIGECSLVEMATGEGKTLTIALAAAVAGWSGKPCHVITANDYLASRDARNLARFYELCGLSVGAVTAQEQGQDRRQQYLASVVYTTGKELVADFLRDQLALGDLSAARRRAVTRLRGFTTGENMTVLRGLSTAIIDEVDNQLIDEAVTPLIISRHQENEVLSAACFAAERYAAGLLPGEDYSINERHREIELMDSGREKVHACCEGQKGFLGARAWMVDLVIRALEARHFYLNGKQYVMMDGKVVIVDEFTGRLMPGRSWRLGVHQAVEAKEASEPTPPSETLARLSFQRFYRFFDHLSGITGTGQEAKAEFWRIYALPFVEIPRHKPNQRKDLSPALFRDSSDKWKAIIDEIQKHHEVGRPVLIGTRNVAASEQLADRLRSCNLAFELLNAVRQDMEAAIIARAGEEGSITIATNMAGRGTDILLGHGVAAKGGLHVIVSEGHSSGRIDRQLRGRAARQGDPGSTRLYAAWDDEIIQRNLPKPLMPLFRPWIVGGLPGWRLLLRSALALSQRAAEKQARRQRFMVLRQDDEVAKSVIGSRPGSVGG